MTSERTVKLAELIHALQSYDTSRELEGVASGVEYDSRQVSAGSVFVAIPGLCVDGADFAGEAVERGACAVVSERAPAAAVDIPWIITADCRQALADLSAKFYNYPGKTLKVCGITGTNGKTTSALMLKKVLEQRNKRVGLISSLSYDTCGEVFPAERTTPESLEIQRLLYLMRENQCNNVVMEVSSHALELKRVENIEFRVGLFTNLTRDHLDFHGDMDSYFAAKRKLLEKLDGLTKYAVVNLDEPRFRELFGAMKSAYLSFSLSDTSADIFVSGFELSAEGTIFDLSTPMGSRTVKLQLVGRFNLMNTLGVVGAAMASGVDLDTIVNGLENYSETPGRLQKVDCGQPFSVLIDYAHTPDAIATVIADLRQIMKGKIIAVFGCGGDRDRGKRKLMAEAACTADLAVVTSDNPRSEDPLKIIEDIKPGLSGEYLIEPERGKAIEMALAKAGEGDLVLLLGKGAETYEITSAGRQEYSELEVTRSALAKLGHVGS